MIFLYWVSNPHSMKIFISGITNSTIKLHIESTRFKHFLKFIRLRIWIVILESVKVKERSAVWRIKNHVMLQVNQQFLTLIFLLRIDISMRMTSSWSNHSNHSNHSNDSLKLSCRESNDKTKISQPKT